MPGRGGDAAVQLSPDDARRLAVVAQLLSAPRPTDLLDVVERLTLLQRDPTRAVAPSADLVLWSRLGSSHDPGDLADALASRQLIELDGMIRPAEDIRLYTAEMAVWPGEGQLRPWQVELRAWVEANHACRRDILRRLDDGPLTGPELPDDCAVPWRSSGWNNDRSQRKLLDLMVARGEVADVGRRGRDRLWDLAERHYPDEEPVPVPEARAERDRLRLRSLGIARATAPQTPGEPDDVGDAGVPASVEGLRGHWRVDPDALECLGSFEPRVAVLSPLDRLIIDRRRMGELFGFDYQLEMYKPAAKRQWGYWAMPVLDGDRLVGKVDAATDRDAGVLRVARVHEDEPFDDRLTAALDAELADLAAWLGVDLRREG